MIPISSVPIIIAFIIGAAIAGTAMRIFDTNEIERLENDILNMQYQAQLKVNEANQAVKVIEKEQSKKIIELQESTDEIIKKNTTLSGQLHALRMQQRAKSASNTARLPANRDTEDTKDSPEAPDVSARLDQFIDERAEIADFNTAYAQSCYEFIQSIPNEMIK